jgi:hypothetical protein
MKQKKEYIILALIILALAGYLVFRHTDRIHYRLPEIGKVDAKEIAKIEVSRGGDTLLLTRKDDAWYIGAQGWQADPEKVKGMLSAISELKVSDLVSESKAYERYGLDAKDKVIVKAFSGSGLKREFLVGKSASTGRHTFIMLPGDTKVYLAPGDFRSSFETTSSALRDTLVLSFIPSEITEIHVEENGKTISLARQDVTSAKSEKPSAPNAARVTVWKNEKGEEADKIKVDTLLAVLSKVSCEEYLDDSVRSSLADPIFTFRLKGTKEYSLTVYGKDGAKTPALSSGTQSAFTLPDSKLDNLKQAVLDIKKP